MSFSTIDQAVEDIKNGKLVIVADDEDRESEGDLVGAAEHVTPEMINFMAKFGRGLICLTLLPEPRYASQRAHGSLWFTAPLPARPVRQRRAERSASCSLQGVSTVP